MFTDFDFRTSSSVDIRLFRNSPYDTMCGVLSKPLLRPTMSTETDVTGPRIASYMNLEQAMGEVRAYLDKKSRPAATATDGSVSPAGQLSMQSAFIAQLGNIATRLGQVEPNSKLGPPGVFLKRLMRKAIGWYSRPAQEFDRTAVETFHQIRQDMLQLQQQIVALNKGSTKRADGRANLFGHSSCLRGIA